ncbi:MAG TPA: HAD-IIA family hydrolase [Thermotogota bacterium]|nr:HAD-IIA family hydrolase [Thermotogota bacterium]NLZ12652.1 HAD-IIA family hydrolase [Thermotogaceae bacterium]MDD8040145.1 HAD-IIA family hydrolase [Thermotogota bacterium]MDD8053098.1 HAD-IIA family hydrolase [Thermotogota bacterium]HNR63079.1 HAD-IIA family hydrolase [Thermotogota bacterium]
MELLWERNEMEVASFAVAKRLTEKNLFILDMDGTIYLDRTPIPGAIDFVCWLKARQKDFVFLTNNSSKSSETYYKNLACMGFEIDRENLCTSNHATILFLKDRFPNQRVLFMGTSDAAEEYKKQGIDLALPFDRCMDSAYDVAVLGYDTGLSYEKLKNFCHWVRKGLFYISTHPDINCPSLEGPLPDNGAMIALIRASTGRSPDMVLGKPQTEMLNLLLKRFGREKAETLIIGDRLYTDIRMGAENGVDTLLVLSGETKEESIPNERDPKGVDPIFPTFVSRSLSETLAFVLKMEA